MRGDRRGVPLFHRGCPTWPQASRGGVVGSASKLVPSPSFSDVRYPAVEVRRFPFLLTASQGTLALLLKAGMKPAAAMMPAAFALVFHGERTRRYGKGRIETISKFSLRRLRGALFVFCDVRNFNHEDQ